MTAMRVADIRICKRCLRQTGIGERE